MPKVSQRAKDISHSPIRSLIPYARQAKDSGIHVHHLNIGQPDIETPSAALAELKLYDQKVIKYGASEGSLILRMTVAAYYSEHVAPISVEDVYVTTGASEGITFALFACFDTGAEIIIPEPFYANYIGFSQMSNVNLVAVSSYIVDGFGLPKPQCFEEKITNKTKAIFLCNPGNPAGNLYSHAELLEIAQIVKKHDLFLIVDEVYREFCYDDDFTSVLHLEGLDDHVIVIDSVSKVFSTCGIRIGFVVSRNQDVLSNILKYAQLRLCPPVIGQHIANSCFLNRADYIADVKEEYRNRRDYLYDRLSAMEGVRCYMPKAAFYIMTELPVDDSQEFCKWLLSDFSHGGETIMVAPGAGFYLNQELGRQQVRIAFVLGQPELKRALDILERALSVYKEQNILASSAALSGM